jgi:segregation and condensation protein B
MTDQPTPAPEPGPGDAGQPADAPSTPEGQPQDALIDAPPVRSPEELRSAVEALLLVVEEPIPEATLAAAVAMPVDAVREALQTLARFYDETGRGFELRQVAGGWRYYTRDEHAELVAGYVLEGQHAKLSPAALETLAVIAYLQPVSRSRVSAVRGVNVDGVMRTLLARDLITETGSEESGATLFATTDYFLERMGIQSLDELPELAPYLPEATELEAELGQLAVVPDLAAPQESGSPESGSPEPGEDSGSQPSGTDQAANGMAATGSEEAESAR